MLVPIVCILFFLVYAEMIFYACHLVGKESHEEHNTEVFIKLLLILLTCMCNLYATCSVSMASMV